MGEENSCKMKSNGGSCWASQGWRFSRANIFREWMSQISFPLTLYNLRLSRFHPHGMIVFLLRDLLDVLLRCRWLCCSFSQQHICLWFRPKGFYLPALFSILAPVTEQGWVLSLALFSGIGWVCFTGNAFRVRKYLFFGYALGTGAFFSGLRARADFLYGHFVLQASWHMCGGRGQTWILLCAFNLIWEGASWKFFWCMRQASWLTSSQDPPVFTSCLFVLGMVGL